MAALTATTISAITAITTIAAAAAAAAAAVSVVVPSVPASIVTIALAVAQVVARAAVGAVATGEGTGADETVWLESLRLTSCDAARTKGCIGALTEEEEEEGEIVVTVMVVVVVAMVAMAAVAMKMMVMVMVLVEAAVAVATMVRSKARGRMGGREDCTVHGRNAEIIAGIVTTAGVRRVRRFMWLNRRCHFKPVRRRSLVLVRRRRGWYWATIRTTRTAFGRGYRTIISRALRRYW